MALPRAEPMPGGELCVFESADGAARVEVRLDGDTVWLTQRQMADVFATSPENILMHIRSVYTQGELDPTATAKNFLAVREEGGRLVRRRLKHYNLEVAISVGYRVNSVRAVRFRQWATQTLREHLIRGFTLNQARLSRNTAEIAATLEFMRRVARSASMTTDEGRGLVEVITRYTQTFLLLQRYDEGLLEEPAGEPGGRLPSVEEVRTGIDGLGAVLRARGEAGELFGRELAGKVAGILGSLEQTVFGEPAYPSVESRAAHLLYFIIKDHPFADGNKRIGSFLFLDFLNRNGRLFLDDGSPVINDIGLAALALLVAESKPRDKDVMIRLVMNMLAVPAP